MTFLTPQQERKQHFIYNLCKNVRNACVLIIVLLFLFAPIVFNLEGILPAYLALVWAVCMLMVYVLFQIPMFLKITSHIEMPKYALPYKAKMDRTMTYIFAVIFGIVIWVLFWGLWPRSPLATIIVVLTVLLIYGGVFLFISKLKDLVLYEDHLLYRDFRNKYILDYKDIEEVNISCRMWFTLSPYIGFIRMCSFTVKMHNRNKEPLKIDPNIFSDSDLLIILNVIHQFAPHATMNELAEQMRNGDFPVA